MKRWIIYMYIFPNGKRYIGATSQTLNGRQGKDFQRYKGCTKLYNAILEFGKDNIEQIIIAEKEMTAEEASELEHYYINKYHSDDELYGYNTCSGGEGLSKRNISDERKEFLRSQMKELGHNNAGRKPSEKTRSKQRNAKLGKKHGPMSEEQKRKISEANSAKNMSGETHIRRSKSKQKQVIATEKTTGEIIIFDSVDDTAEYFGVKSSSVSRWICGKRNPTNNYTFKFYSPTTTE